MQQYNGNSAVQFYPDEFESPLMYNAHAHFRGYGFWQYIGADGERHNVAKDVLRQQEELMQLVVPIQTNGPVWGAAVEPNLPVPNTGFGTAQPYQSRILNLTSPESHFRPMVSVQICGQTTESMIEEVCFRFSNRFTQQPPEVFGKLYLEKVTNSPVGVSVEELFAPQMLSVLGLMEIRGMVLQVHPEVFCGDDIFGCEEAFIPILLRLVKLFPRLKISVEHVSTKELLEAVLSLPDNVVATFTLHHVIGDTSEFWQDGRIVDPIAFSRSVLRGNADRLALIAAIADPTKRRKLSLGLDDAPHLRSAKLKGKKPGIWLPIWAISLLYEVGEEHQVPLEALTEVACHNAPRFYGLTIPTTHKLKIKRIDEGDAASKQLIIPHLYRLGGTPLYAELDEDDPTEGLVPYRAGHQCRWQFERVPA